MGKGKAISLLAAVAAVLLAKQTSAQNIPCLAGTNLPAGCDNTRIKPCASFSSGEIAGANVIEPDTNYGCSSTSPRVRDTVFAGPSTNTYFVKFDDSAGNCFGIVMQAGECWGDHPTNGGDYDCQGRCGAGCSSGNSNWARDCLKHDVCSWYFSASGGSSDSNCGDSFGHATNDFLSFGSGCRANGDSCTQPTPNPTPLPTPGPGTCADIGGLTYSDGRPAPCDEIQQYCSAYAIVRERCALTCGECSPGGGGGGPSCQDNVPSGITYSNGNPAPCNEIGQYCSQYDFVRAACPATCGQCGGSNLVALPEEEARPPLPPPDESIIAIAAGVSAAAVCAVALAAVVIRRRRKVVTQEDSLRDSYSGNALEADATKNVVPYSTSAPRIEMKRKPTL